eukprot:gene25284-biopygen9863
MRQAAIGSASSRRRSFTISVSSWRLVAANPVIGPSPRAGNTKAVVRGCSSRITNAVLDAGYADKDWPLRHWRRDTLFSVAARRGWVAPDLEPLP